VALVDKLVEYGASVEPLGGGDWASPLHTALVFGYRDAAEALVRHGARIRDVSDAAGLGRMEEVRRLLPEADGGARRRALALAAQLGHAGIVGLLLDAGEDPDRFNPKGHHAHATPLHLAALAGNEDVVRLLVARGARIDIQDKHWHSTPLGWARHGGQAHVVKYLSLS
jgi:ankyrin repeat protein